MGSQAIRFGLVGQTLGILMIIFPLILNTTPGVRLEGEVLALIGTSVLVAGCGRFAEHRRRNWWWGTLGFFNIAGVLALLMIPRRKAIAGFDLSVGERRRDVWRMEVHVTSAILSEPILLHLPRGAKKCPHSGAR